MSATCPSEYRTPTGVVRCDREAGHPGRHLTDPPDRWEARVWGPEHEVKR